MIIRILTIFGGNVTAQVSFLRHSVLATAPHSPPLTLLETSASYMTNISLFSDQISSTSRSCYYHICQLRCIRPYLDTKTASTIATSIVPLFTLDYCNSLYHNLPMSQITRLQQIQNSLACAVVKAPKSSHTTPILRIVSQPITTTTTI